MIGFGEAFAAVGKYVGDGACNSGRGMNTGRPGLGMSGSTCWNGDEGICGRFDDGIEPKFGWNKFAEPKNGKCGEPNTGNCCCCCC